LVRRLRRYFYKKYWPDSGVFCPGIAQFFRNKAHAWAFRFLDVSAGNHMPKNTKSGKTPNTKGNAPKHRGGDQARKAQEWGGGNKGGKGTEKKKAQPFAKLDDALRI
jgi:hypothetical protein